MTVVDIVPAVYCRLENRPGSLERAARTLGDSRINIDSISLETNGNSGFARILTSRPREAVEALRRSNVEAWESSVVIVNLQNRPGELARASADLAAAGLNVESITTTTEGKLAIRTNDLDRTASILRKL